MKSSYSVRNLIVASLLLFVVASGVSRWLQSRTFRESESTVRAPIPRSARSHRVERILPHRSPQGSALIARSTEAVVTGVQDGRTQEGTKEAVSSLSDIAQLVDDNREDLRSLLLNLRELTLSLKKKNLTKQYDVMQLLNFTKDTMGAARCQCEEAEHRFWTALRSGDRDAGIYQNRWGESLLKLRELESAARRLRSELEEIATLEDSPDPQAYLQHSHLGLRIRPHELHAVSSNEKTSTFQPDLEGVKERIRIGGAH